jgi:hypothetical protein
VSQHAPSHTIHNARLMLFANLLNTVAGSSLAIGVLTPIAAVFFYGAAPPGLRLFSIVIGVVFWLAAAVVLHIAARRVLGGLRE